MARLGTVAVLCLLLLYVPKEAAATTPANTSTGSAPRDTLAFSAAFRDILSDYSNGRRVERPSAIGTQVYLDGFLPIVPATPPAYAWLPPGTIYVPEQQVLDNRFGLLLPPTVDVNVSELPEAADVFSKLLARDSFRAETDINVNFLFASFANWVMNDFTRTQEGSNGSMYWSGAGLQLASLYGNTTDRQTALRTLKGGKMAVTVQGGSEFPPLWETVKKTHPDFYMQTFGLKGNASALYALGDPKYNQQAGLLLWSTLFLQAHNQVCELVAKERPQYSDQQLFETARLVMNHVLLKVIMEDFVGTAISPVRDLGIIKYDPGFLRSLRAPRPKTNAFAELGLLSQWWALLPANITLPSQVAPLDFAMVLWNPQWFQNTPWREIIQGFRETPVGAFGPNNIPGILATEAVFGPLSDSRELRLRPFNEYRRLFGLPPMRRWSDWGMGPNATRDLEALYGSVDRVELYVGAILESARPERHSLLPETYEAGLTALVLSLLLNHDLIRNEALSSEATLTAAGQAFIANFSLSEQLGRMAGSPVGRCPFFLADSNCRWLAAATEEPTGWVWANLYDYVGFDDLLWPPFFSDGAAWRWTFALLLILATAQIAMCWGLHRFLLTFCTRTYMLLPEAERYGAVLTANFAATYAVGCVPHTVLLFMALFGPNMADTVERFRDVFFLAVVTKCLLFAMDGTYRVCLVRPDAVLLGQHLLYYALVLLAVFGRSIFVVKAALIVDYCIIFEAGLLLAALAQQLRGTPRLLARFSAAGRAIYCATRALQAVLLLGLFIGGGPRMAGDPLYWACGALCLALAALQLLMLCRYFEIWMTNPKSFTALSADEKSLQQDTPRSSIASFSLPGKGLPPSSQHARSGSLTNEQLLRYASEVHAANGTPAEDRGSPSSQSFAVGPRTLSSSTTASDRPLNGKSAMTSSSSASSDRPLIIGNGKLTVGTRRPLSQLLESMGRMQKEAGVPRTPVQPAKPAATRNSPISPPPGKVLDTDEFTEVDIGAGPIAARTSPALPASTQLLDTADFMEVDIGALDSGEFVVRKSGSAAAEERKAEAARSLDLPPRPPSA